MRSMGLVLVCLLLVGTFCSTAEARHRWRGCVGSPYSYGYSYGYGAPGYMPYGSSFYRGGYYGPGMYGGPTPFYSPARAYGAYYYGPYYGW
jgi:hypothetical protein